MQKATQGIDSTFILQGERFFSTLRLLLPVLLGFPHSELLQKTTRLMIVSIVVLFDLWKNKKFITVIYVLSLSSLHPGIHPADFMSRCDLGNRFSAT